MAVSDNCKYVAYRLSGLPVGAFGETYVVATALKESAGAFRYEYFVVSKRLKPHLFNDALSFVPNDVPEELLKVDIDFLVGEAKQQAEIYLFQKLSEIAEISARPNFLDFRIELVEMSYMPLHGCWMRGDFIEETKTIAQATQCDRLKRYLSLLTRSSFTRRPG